MLCQIVKNPIYVKNILVYDDVPLLVLKTFKSLMLISKEFVDLSITKSSP